MKASADNRSISLILRALREGSLVPTPPFQRRAVWANVDKVAFIETILLKYPFPEIYVASGRVDTKAGEAEQLLVDGQQRVRAIEAYFRGASPFNRTHKTVKKYKDLSEEEKEDFLSYEVAVRNLGRVDPKLINDVFRRMNKTSYSLNDMERHNAVYLGEFKKFCEALAEHPFLKEIKLFSSNDIRRMKDVSFIASLVATMMSTYFTRDDEVENYLSMYNEGFPRREEMAARVNGVFAFLKSLTLEPNSRAWKKADFYTLATEVDRQLHAEHRLPDPKLSSERLSELFTAVDAAREEGTSSKEVEKYFEATLQGTNDRGPRIARAEVLRTIFSGVGSTAYELKLSPEATELPEVEDLQEEQLPEDLFAPQAKAADSGAKSEPRAAAPKRRAAPKRPAS